jgi:hypothetical protein
MSSLVLPPGSPLSPLLERQPTLVIFLRHFNCTFCREAIADVEAARPDLEAGGVAIAFVHASPESEAARWFDRRGLDGVTVVSDPGLAHYRAFGLHRTGVTALLSPRVWARGAACALSHGFGVQPPHLLRQLAGVFVAYRDRVLASFRHTSPADRPDYRAMVAGSRKPGVTIGEVRPQTEARLPSAGSESV